MSFKQFLLYFIIMVFAANPILAQGTRGKITVHAIPTIGLINGSKGASVILQTIGGASFRNFFVGAGMGIDYYRFRSIPVFADLRYTFGSKGRSLFLYGDLGQNYAWLTQKNKGQYSNINQSNFQGGLYYDAGFGYQIKFGHRDALLLSAGFSKKIIRDQVSSNFCPFVGPCSKQDKMYVYKMPRVSIKAGWKF